MLLTPDSLEDKHTTMSKKVPVKYASKSSAGSTGIEEWHEITLAGRILALCSSYLREAVFRIWLGFESHGRWKQPRDLGCAKEC